MPRPPPHGPASLPPATSTAAVRRSAVRSRMVARRYWDPMFNAAVLRSFSVLAIFFVTGFGFFLFAEAESFFHFFQLFRVETLGFIFPGSLIIHVCIAHGFHQLTSHGDHLLAGLAQNFFLQFLELAHVWIFFKAGKIAFIFLDFFFLNHAARLLWMILFSDVLSIACGGSP